MVQVDPSKSNRTYLSIKDPDKPGSHVHETVYGLTPTETMRIIRDALIAEMRRRAVQPQAEVA